MGGSKQSNSKITTLKQRKFFTFIYRDFSDSMKDAFLKGSCNVKIV